MNNSGPIGRMALQHLDLDKLVQFGDHFLVDHPALDAQHKAIFDLGVNLYEGWRGGGSIDVLRPGIEKLSNLLHSHFSYEERVLDDIGYDDLKGHAAEHQAMRDELSIMHDRFHRLEAPRGKASIAPGQTIMQFVLGITVGHVASSDMRYCRALMADRPIPADDFWRGGDAVCRRYLEAGQPSAARSVTRLQARLARHAGDRSADAPTLP
jgi:hemerythrin-like metal-binding protein